MENHDKFMQMAIDLATENMNKGGGPFGAVIVLDGKIVGKGANNVTILNDPTAHAEVIAIRDASKNLNRFDLSDCTIYTSCEPCPMCMGAVYWAKIKTLFYGNSRKDAADIGFDDDFIYRELNIDMSKRSILMTRKLDKEAIKTFDKWRIKADKMEY